MNTCFHHCSHFPFAEEDSQAVAKGEILSPFGLEFLESAMFGKRQTLLSGQQCPVLESGVGSLPICKGHRVTAPAHDPNKISSKS